MDDIDAEENPFWERIEDCPNSLLWEAHKRQKLELAFFCRRRLQAQFARHGESPSLLEGLAEALDPDVLTIGFARRFATYKRAALLFSDEERLARILLNERAAGPDRLRRQGPSGRSTRPAR